MDKSLESTRPARADGAKGAFVCEQGRGSDCERVGSVVVAGGAGPSLSGVGTGRVPRQTVAWAGSGLAGILLAVCWIVGADGCIEGRSLVRHSEVTARIEIDNAGDWDPHP